jgi:hypothetical protein
MPSSYTTSGRYTKQGNAENDNTWGTIANENTIDIIDQNVNGVAAIDVTTASNITLTANNGASDEARRPILKLTGTPTANIDIITPAVPKYYMVDGAFSGTFQVRVIPTGSSVGVTFSAGETGLVYCDGTDIFPIYVKVPEIKPKHIIMVSGTIADALTDNPGFALCDGNNGTPDLRDRFVVCARQDDSGAAKTNISGSLTVSGGSTTSGNGGAVAEGISGSTVLTSANIPTLATNATNGLTMDGDGTPVIYGGGTRTLFQKLIQWINSSPTGHTHTVPAIPAHNHPGTIPPYYAIAFLMKL